MSCMVMPRVGLVMYFDLEIRHLNTVVFAIFNELSFLMFDSFNDVFGYVFFKRSSLLHT